MAAPKAPQGKVDRAVALRREGRTLEDAAREAGVSTGTLKRALRGARDGAPRADLDGQATPLAKADQEPATRHGEGATEEPRGEAPRSLVGALEDELVDAIRERRRAKSPGDKAKLGRWVQTLIAQLDRLRPDPAPTREELEAKLRPRALDVLGKVRNGLVSVAQREAETGKCLRCGHELAPEAVLRRRIEAGMADPPAVH